MSNDHDSHKIYANALNKSLEIIVSYTEEAIDKVLSNGLQPVAETAELDRIIIYRIFGIESETVGEIYRWDKAGSGTFPVDPAFILLPVNAAIKRWLSIISDDACISIKRSDFTEDETEFLAPRGVMSILIAPVFIKGEFWGVVTFNDNTNEREFNEDCTLLLRSAARLCVTAIIQDQLKQKIIDEIEFNRIMFEAAPIGLTVFNEFLKIFDCNEAITKLYGVTKEYYIEHFTEFSPEYQPDGIKTTDKLPDIMKRALNGERIVTEWMHQTLNGEPFPCELFMTRSRYKGKFIGIAYIYDLRNIKKMEQNIQYLETEVKKINYDPLTGIYNRRYLDENMKRILKTLSRAESVLSVMMVDIDFFKDYNDTYGHNEGDKCLKIVAEVLLNCITRADDFVARYGGEEFLVVLPNTGENGVKKIAERLLENMRNRNIPHSNSEAANCVTFSIGATSGVVKYTYTEEDFIQLADKMLYKSKQSGRNKYSFEAFNDPEK